MLDGINQDVEIKFIYMLAEWPGAIQSISRLEILKKKRKHVT